MEPDYPNDAEAVLAWIADRLDRPRWTDGAIHGEQCVLSDMLRALREQPFAPVADGFGFRWPAGGDRLVLRRYGRVVAVLVCPPGAQIPAVDLARFHADVVAALRPGIERFFGLAAVDRVRRRLAGLGFRIDLTRRQWSTLVGPWHWALADRIDFAALDELLARHRNQDVRWALSDQLRAAAAGTWQTGKASPQRREVARDLTAALRVAPAHVLLRTYLRHNPDERPEPVPMGARVTRHVGTRVVRHVADGRDLAVVYEVSYRHCTAVAAYDLAHAHPAAVPVPVRQLAWFRESSTPVGHADVDASSGNTRSTAAVRTPGTQHPAGRGPFAALRRLLGR